MNISSMKIWPFDFAAGALDGVDISPEDLRAGMAPFEAIRKAHSDRMSIKAELHGIWGLGAAKAICAALKLIRPDWVEDPIWMDRTADIAELTASTRAPLAGGETLGGLGQLRLHDCSGPVTLTVSTHLAMACPNAGGSGYFRGWGGRMRSGVVRCGPDRGACSARVWSVRWSRTRARNDP